MKNDHPLKLYTYEPLGSCLTFYISIEHLNDICSYLNYSLG